MEKREEDTKEGHLGDWASALGLFALPAAQFILGMSLDAFEMSHRQRALALVSLFLMLLSNMIVCSVKER